jgi:hypothetical protein
MPERERPASVLLLKTAHFRLERTLPRATIETRAAISPSERKEFRMRTTARSLSASLCLSLPLSLMIAPSALAADIFVAVGGTGSGVSWSLPKGDLEAVAFGALQNDRILVKQGAFGFAGGASQTGTDVRTRTLRSDPCSLAIWLSDQSFETAAEALAPLIGGA